MSSVTGWPKSLPELGPGAFRRPAEPCDTCPENVPLEHSLTLIVYGKVHRRCKRCARSQAHAIVVSPEAP